MHDQQPTRDVSKGFQPEIYLKNLLSNVNLFHIHLKYLDWVKWHWPKEYVGKRFRVVSVDATLEQS